ncbi:MAG: hypothetical protein K0S65_6224 [Labilithrix sp.]|nr:hypothetical protein [Labilithrix sp.]
MFLFSMVIGIAGGLLAMSSLLVGRSAQAAEKLATLAKYQGWIGLTMFGWGVWELVQCVLNMGLLGSHPVSFLFWALSGVADFAVGLLLGFGLISTYVFRGNAMAIAKGDAIRSKLVAFQVPLGGLAIVMSLVYGVLHFV